MIVSELFDEFERDLKRYAQALTRDTDRADDLVQETFLRAMAHEMVLKDLNEYQRRAWLRKTCKNLFLDELRSLNRQQALLQELAPLEEEADIDMGAAPGVFEAVPDRFRQLLQQRYVLGMTSEEIARGEGVPPATVRSRLHLAIQWLRTHQSQFQF